MPNTFWMYDSTRKSIKSRLLGFVKKYAFHHKKDSLGVFTYRRYYAHTRTHKYIYIYIRIYIYIYIYKCVCNLNLLFFKLAKYSDVYTKCRTMSRYCKRWNKFKQIRNLRIQLSRDQSSRELISMRLIYIYIYK